ncbi:MAG: tetratricopeptide repeat protein [Pirellulales bacterium]|nr:tetratricopeptide repeat protein [Pirellulales bacterium]
MDTRHWVFSALIVACAFAVISGTGNHGLAEDTISAETPAQSPGLEDLDEALRVRVTSQDFKDLNRVVELVESSLDKGLDGEDKVFASNMLVNALMERATTFMQVINMRPLQNPQIKRVRQLLASDLRRVLDCDDPPVEAGLMLGRLQALPEGDPYEARRVLNDYLQNEELPREKRAEALVLRGGLIKEAAKALADFDEAVELVPENETYRLARAALLRSHGKLEEALEAIGEILERNPDVANALLLQGQIYRSLDRLDEAIASFDSATDLVPTAPIPYQSRGEIYRVRGEFEKAVEQFSKVLELKPGVLMTLVQRAEAYLNADKPELALTDSELVLEKQPLIAAHRIRADALSKLDRLEEAITEMERLAEALPAEPEVHIQLALYYLADNRPAKAVDAYSEVLAVDHDNFLVLRSRADLYLTIGKHKEAIADFERALKQQPEDSSMLNNLAWVLATSPVDGLRDGPRAIKLATKACELTEYKLPHIISTLAATFAESGNFESAIKWSQKSVDMNDPQYSEDLKKELTSYRSGKPWRERQEIDGLEESANEPLADMPQDPSHPEIPSFKNPGDKILGDEGLDELSPDDGEQPGDLGAQPGAE